MKKEVHISQNSLNSIESGNIKPCRELKNYIECYWYVINSKIIDPPLIAITPSGSFNIILDLTKNRNHDAVKLYGIFNNSFNLLSSSQNYFLGIKFLPGGISSFIDVPASEFNSKIVSLSDIIGKKTNEFLEKITAQKTINEQIFFLERYLIETLNKKSLKTPFIIKKIISDYKNMNFITSDIIFKRSDVCERQLRRIFNQYIGTTPGEFVRMSRMQSVIDFLADNPSINIVELANMTGYYDQSHFIKEFKKFVGITPNNFKQKLSKK